MAPHFTFFSKSSAPNQVLTNLREIYGEVFVDGLTSTVDMLCDRYRGVNGFFCYFGSTKITMERLDYYKTYDDNEIYDSSSSIPHILLSFDKDKDITSEESGCIQRFLDALIDPRNQLPDEFFELVPKPLKVENTAPEKNLEPEKELLPDYSFEYKVDSSVDIAFCQVCKPYTDRPYTLIIRNFSEKGLKGFFSGIFASTSWGVCSHDYVFLQKLWKFLDMEKDYGKLDLEKLLKDHIEKCTQGLSTEPEIYRLGYKTVCKNFEKSRNKKRLLIN